MRYTPTPSVATDVIRAMALSESSLSRGSSIISSAPAIGRNTAAVSAQWSKPFMSLLGKRDEGCAEHDQRAEEDRRVLLDAAGLGLAEDDAAFLRGIADAVDGAVDHLLVDEVVDEAGRVAAADAGAVDDPVDDVLVDPVGGARDRTLDGADHGAGVEVVEVV